MLKIYLDWNCITNIEERDPELFELIKKCTDFILFPYSSAHIRDVLAGKHQNAEWNSTNMRKDLQYLDIISQRYYLTYDSKIDCIQPHNKPYYDIIEKCGLDIQRISNMKLFSPWLYSCVKKGVQRKLQETPKSYHRIQGVSYENVFVEIEHFISGLSKMNKIPISTLSYRPSDNLEKKIKKLSLKLDIFGFKTEKLYKRFSNK